MQNPQSPRNEARSSGDQSHAGAREDNEPTDDTTSGVKDKIADGASAAQEKLGEGADAARQGVASGLEEAATRMHERAESSGGVQAKIEDKAAGALGGASRYLNDHTTQQLWNDLQRLVKDHPLQASVGALAVGYVLAKVTR